MRLFQSMRWIMLALLLLSALPASVRAQISISVGFAPPELPVYEQPICPQPNLLWTPGYWAYGGADYYWVPGAWVPAPYQGALWTPNYWGWSGGHYRFHQGYWGPHVGYYGGVNYGGGYGGEGFAGGEWRGGSFAYNTAVVHVNETIIHTTYIDRTVVERGIVENPHHVAYNGGPGGIRRAPSQQDRVVDREQHVAPTQFQAQHMQTAKVDKTSYAKANGGHPKILAQEKPLAEEKHAPPPGMKVEPKIAPKADPNIKAQPKQAAPKVEPKPVAPKPEPKQAAPKVEPKPAVPKPEPKQAAPRVEPKPVAPRPEPRQAAPRVEPKPAASRPEPKPAAHKAQPKQESTPENKPK